MHDWKAEIKERLSGLDIDPGREREIVDELAQHLEDRYQELRLSGASEPEAYHDALEELAGSQQLKRDLGRIVRRPSPEPIVFNRKGRFSMISSLLQDLHYAARMLRRTPGFTSIAVLCMALGIGGTTTIFSIIHPILLTRLPYKDPNRVAMIFSIWRFGNRTGDRGAVSGPDMLEWRNRAHSFEQIEAFSVQQVSLAGGDAPLRVQTASVTGGLFSLLGIDPRMGRVFSDDEQSSGVATEDVLGQRRAPVAVISDKLWRADFGADPGTVGKTITLDGSIATIVGIMPPGFSFPLEADLWLPIQIPTTRSNAFLTVIGRLASNVSLEQARSEMSAVAHALHEEHPSSDNDLGLNTISLRRYLVGDVEPTLLVLFGAVSFVLLIACANVANLLLARSASRQKEIAIRASLGAGRLRIVRQLLTESALLSLIGGGAGLLLATGGLQAFLALTPSSRGQAARYGMDVWVRPDRVGIDLWALGFAVLLSLLTGLLFGLVPALSVSKPNVNESLKEGGTRTGPGRGRLRGWLVVSEVALTLVLLVGSGLMIKSFVLLIRTRLGFSTKNVLSLSVSLPSTVYQKPEQIKGYYQQGVQNLQSLPGIASAAVISATPLGRVGLRIRGDFTIEGSPEPPTRLLASKLVASGDYFRAMSIPLVHGRYFDDRDGDGAPPVVIISDSLAREVWPGESALGKRINIGFDQEPLREIVGIVGDARQDGMNWEPAALYQPYLQTPRAWQLSVMSFIVRTDSDPKSRIADMRAAIQSVDKDVPIYAVESMDQVVSEYISDPRFYTALLGALAAIALVLAAAGVYGIISYSVSQRTHEIGIRMALGSSDKQVVAMFLRSGIVLSLVGTALGLAGAYGLTRFISAFLYGTTPTDGITFAAVPVLLAAIAILASYIPARRAARVDPMTALRYE
jgi:putative ABC transport system permease protein